MSKYDRFQGTPQDGLEHCYYCGLDYKPVKGEAHECQEECKKCGKDIIQDEGRYHLYGTTYCIKCGEWHNLFH